MECFGKDEKGQNKWFYTQGHCPYVNSYLIHSFCLNSMTSTETLYQKCVEDARNYQLYYYKIYSFSLLPVTFTIGILAVFSAKLPKYCTIRYSLN